MTCEGLNALPCTAAATSFDAGRYEDECAHAPGTLTGKYRVQPAPKCLLSKLPPAAYPT